MTSRDQQLLQYIQLADLSQSRRQAAGRDRFLLLAATTACTCGLLDLAEQLRERVVDANPHHLVAKYASMTSALRDPDFEPFQRHLQRFCSPEQAEHLLARQGRAGSTVQSTDDLLAAIASIFAQGHWEAGAQDGDE